jgi:hypothetical protein
MPPTGRAVRPEPTTLHLVAGPGDDGQPVLTPHAARRGLNHEPRRADLRDLSPAQHTAPHRPARAGTFPPGAGTFPRAARRGRTHRPARSPARHAVASHARAGDRPARPARQPCPTGRPRPATAPLSRPDLLNLTPAEPVRTIAYELTHVIRRQEGTQQELARGLLTTAGLLAVLAVSAVLAAGYVVLAGSARHVGLLVAVGVASVTGMWLVFLSSFSR